jgi:hypothetical protein
MHAHGACHSRLLIEARFSMTTCLASARWFLLLGFATLATTGCATINPDPFNLLGAKKNEPLDPAKAVIVEIRADAAAPAAVPVAHLDGMLVQDALAKSGVIKRFSRMDVKLMRPRPDGKGPHKMDVTYDGKARRVSPGTDYALLPGDRVIVVEDTRTEFDDMVDKIVGPFQIFSGKK